MPFVAEKPKATTPERNSLDKPVKNTVMGIGDNRKSVVKNPLGLDMFASGGAKKRRATRACEVQYFYGTYENLTSHVHRPSVFSFLVGSRTALPSFGYLHSTSRHRNGVQPRWFQLSMHLLFFLFVVPFHKLTWFFKKLELKLKMHQMVIPMLLFMILHLKILCLVIPKLQ